MLPRRPRRALTVYHRVPEADARRRFTRSWDNLDAHYLPLADAAWVFDVSGAAPKLLRKTP